MLTLVHGDLLFKNILIENNSNEIYFIDWEFTRERVFFFDIFNLMFMEVLEYNNFLCFNNYFLGDFDDLFILLFQAVGLDYKEENRFLYFNNFYKQRFNDIALLTQDEKLTNEEIKNIELLYINSYNLIKKRYNNDPVFVRKNEEKLSKKADDNELISINIKNG